MAFKFSLFSILLKDWKVTFFEVSTHPNEPKASVVRAVGRMQPVGRARRPTIGFVPGNEEEEA